MKLLKVQTKKGRKFAEDYWYAKFNYLYQVYDKFSQEKRKAEFLCRCKMNEENGHDFRIMSWNTFGFTCGWELPNGEIRVETKNNSYMIYNIPK